jgi:hypothetical protein
MPNGLTYERCVDVHHQTPLAHLRVPGILSCRTSACLGSGKGKVWLVGFQIGGESSQPLPREGIWRCCSLDEIEGPELKRGRMAHG